MAVEHDQCGEGAQQGGKGHGADSGADGRGSIAREGSGGSGGGGEVEGDYVDEDIGSLEADASVVCIFLVREQCAACAGGSGGGGGGGGGWARMKHTDRSAAALAERTGGWTGDGLEARGMFRHVCRAGDEGQAGRRGAGAGVKKSAWQRQREAHRPMDRHLPPLTCRW